MASELEIVEDVQKVARSRGVGPAETFSSSMYFTGGGRFSPYHIYLNGKGWSYYCTKAGFRPDLRKRPIPEKVYFERLQKARQELGRPPKTSERKKYGLNFKHSRWPTLQAFIEYAVEKGEGGLPPIGKAGPPTAPLASAKSEQGFQKPANARPQGAARPVPPIPEESRRKNWQRIGVDGFHYAPHDESGVVALLAILCADRTIPWQIISLNSGKGIDAICWQEEELRHIKVELKFRLSRTSWNHDLDSLDYVVCWENHWPDFPKQVVELKTIVQKRREALASRASLAAR